MKKNLFVILAVAAGLLMVSSGAMAQEVVTGDSMGNSMCKVIEIFTGKYLFAFSVLAVVGAGLALLFGGEITDGLKKIATIIAIVGMIMMGTFIMGKIVPQTCDASGILSESAVA